MSDVGNFFQILAMVASGAVVVLFFLRISLNRHCKEMCSSDAVIQKKITDVIPAKAGIQPFFIRHCKKAFMPTKQSQSIKRDCRVATLLAMTNMNIFLGSCLRVNDIRSDEKNSKDTKLSLISFYLSVVSTLLSFLFLIYSFVISDFSLQTVFLNSSTLKPLIFKIAGSWSSHEGSILLWLCLLQIISCCYVYLLEDKQLAILILSILQLLFGSFIYFTSNPFNTFSFVPSQGLGLNPTLQDIALGIHPPILYLGYVSYAVPFTCGYIILINPTLRFENLRLLKTFANIGILFTTIGVALGSWWAYRELGWGGFWFFDPVENISLFPWLSAIALHHSVLVTIKTGRMQSWTIILSIITFLLVIFSTFLVRSGFITSIHSFAASPERRAYLLTIFIIIALGSAILLLRNSSLLGDALASTWQSRKKSALLNLEILFSRLPRRHSVPSHNDDGMTTRKNSTKEKGIILGSICFLTSLVVLISATLYPVIYSLFDDKPIIINEEFFVNNFIIFVIPILFIAAFFTTKNSFKKHALILLFSFTICYAISYKVKYGFISASVIIFATFLMLHNINFLLNRTRYFQKSLKASSAAVFLGHFGFALISFSITINSLLQSEVDFTGSIGESKILGEFKVTLQNIKFAQGENYYRQIAEFWLEDKENKITILRPENRFYIIEKTLSQESDIYSYLIYDLYAVLSNIDNDIIHARIYYRPMMSFIWLGVIITASGFLIGLINRRKLKILES